MNSRHDAGQIMRHLGQNLVRVSGWSGRLRRFPTADAATASTVAGAARLVAWGLCIGLVVGVVLAVFRITAGSAYEWVLTLLEERQPLWLALWLVPAILGALAVGRIIRDPAVRYGGGPWVREALAGGQPHVWRAILGPKYLGSWLVKCCGVSVGMEGPCIQMGAATALGLGTDAPEQAGSPRGADSSGTRPGTADTDGGRRMVILTGCAAGLAAAFSAPFSGIFYLLEVMRERLTKPLLIMLLAGSLGISLSVTGLFGLGLILPLREAALPPPAACWAIALTGLCGGVTGVIYNWLLHGSVALYDRAAWLPVRLRPLLPFVGAALVFGLYPVATGEGLLGFNLLEQAGAPLSALCVFLAVKLVFTAFCYGSGVPAGVMVPVLCLGAVTGSICADVVLGLVGAPAGFAPLCVAAGMASAFAGAERAPLTGTVLVLEMTGAWVAAPAVLLAGGAGLLVAHCARVRAL